MDIRHATAEDRDSLIALEAELQTQHHERAPFMYPPSAVIPHEQYTALLDKPDEGVLFAVEDGEAAGYLQYELIDRPASYFTHPEKLLFVHVLTVRETHRGRRIGEALLTRAREIAHDYGANRIALEVWTFNDGAVRFYERVGFEKMKHIMSMPLTEKE